MVNLILLVKVEELMGSLEWYFDLPNVQAECMRNYIRALVTVSVRWG